MSPEPSRSVLWSLAYGVAWTTYTVLGVFVHSEEDDDVVVIGADHPVVVETFTPARAADEFLEEFDRRFPAPDPSALACDTCGGSGSVHVVPYATGVRTRFTCSVCRGTGRDS